MEMDVRIGDRVKRNKKEERRIWLKYEDSIKNEEYRMFRRMYGTNVHFRRDIHRVIDKIFTEYHETKLDSREIDRIVREYSDHKIMKERRKDDHDVYYFSEIDIDGKIFGVLVNVEKYLLERELSNESVL